MRIAPDGKFGRVRLDGLGGSSMLDGVICRYKDANTAWTAASDGTLEERVYLLQNWRGDVSLLVDSGSNMRERVKYFSYGIPFAMPAAEVDSDGDCDAVDTSTMLTWINTSVYNVLGDLDLDGDVDATDRTTAINSYRGTTLGFGVLSNIGNRKGYAGYEKDANLANKCHVRNRVLDSELGRWTRRDPLGYVDGRSLYEYVVSRPTGRVDPLGKYVISTAPRGGVQPGSGPVGELNPIDRTCPSKPWLPEFRKLANWVDDGIPIPIPILTRGTVREAQTIHSGTALEI